MQKTHQLIRGVHDTLVLVGMGAFVLGFAMLLDANIPVHWGVALFAGGLATLLMLIKVEPAEMLQAEESCKREQQHTH